MNCVCVFSGFYIVYWARTRRLPNRITVYSWKRCVQFQRFSSGATRMMALYSSKFTLTWWQWLSHSHNAVWHVTIHTLNNIILYFMIVPLWLVNDGQWKLGSKQACHVMHWPHIHCLTATVYGWELMKGRSVAHYGPLRLVKDFYVFTKWFTL